MPIITTENGQTFACHDTDTIVRAALRAGLGFPYECNSGSCGTCKFTLVEGEVNDLMPGAAGLTERDARKQRKLGCQSQPCGDLTIKVNLDEAYVPAHRPSATPASLVSIEPVTHDIYSWRFKPEQRIDFLPGQYALINIPGVGERAYSMSGTGAEPYLEFMIKKVPGGTVSNLLFSLPDASALPTITVDGPYGIAHYRKRNTVKVCLAGGSGLAPMIAIARAHLASGAPEPLHFFFGGKTDADLLEPDAFRALTGDKAGRINYYPVASEHTRIAGTLNGFLHTAFLEVFNADLNDLDIYCAGPPALTSALELTLSEKGFPPEHLFFDRFC